MSTEWLQIVLVLVIVCPLVVLTGRYLYWRQWDKERRERRQFQRGVREICDWAESRS